MTQYFKITDLEDKVFGIVEKGEEITIAEHNSAARRTSFRKLPSLNQSDFTGKLVEINKQEYAEILKGDWGFKPEVAEPEESSEGEEAPSDIASVGAAAVIPSAEAEPAEATTEEVAEVIDPETGVAYNPQTGEEVALEGVDPAVEGADVTVAPDATTGAAE